jgi:hypothetical protein
MFVSEYRGEFKLFVVKNGRLSSKVIISKSEATKLQRNHKLKGVEGILLVATLIEQKEVMSLS